MAVERSKSPPLVLWGCSTSRTLRAHWALRELGLDCEHRPIGPRTGETRTAQANYFTRPELLPPSLEGGVASAGSS